MSLTNKKILVGISAGIAAYKIPDLVRRLREQGALVRVVMTESAQAFITPLTLQAVSGHPVAVDLFDAQAEAAMNHIELARWPDLILVAPASADMMAKIAYGFAQDLLSTLILASKAPVWVAPAMNQVMWEQEITQKNISLLMQRGIQILGPAAGAQACGEIGPGRMLEPLAIVSDVASFFENTRTTLLKGKHVLITAGPTQEAIDPVRYLSNHSSGKMGFALAESAVRAGAHVTLISGPVNCLTPPGVYRIDVVSTQQMHDAVLEHVNKTDIFIGCAAVSDYRPESVSSQKIKKSQTDIQLKLIKNPDILTCVTKSSPDCFVVGFALESERLKENANKKLKEKHLDMICANSIGDDKGFKSDYNELFIFTKNEEIHLKHNKKQVIADQLIQKIAERFHGNCSS